MVSAKKGKEQKKDTGYAGPKAEPPPERPAKPPRDEGLVDRLTHQTVFHWNPDSDGWKVERAFTMRTIADIGLMVLFYLLLVVALTLHLTSDEGAKPRKAPANPKKIVLSEVEGSVYCAIFAMLVWLVMLIANTCASSVRSALGNKKTTREMERRLASLRASPLDVQFKMQCWHAKKGGKKQKTIKTHKATLQYNYQRREDHAPVSLAWMNEFPRLFARFEVRRTSGNDETERDFQARKAAFIKENSRDRHNDFSLLETVDGFSKHDILLCSTKEYKEEGMGSGRMIFAAILGFAGGLKAKHRMNNPSARVVLEKKIFI